MTRNLHAEAAEIRAGVGVGPYRLGMSLEELSGVLMSHGEREDLPLHTKIEAGAFVFWIDKASGMLSQIMVGRGFSGRFLDEIGIGSTLADVTSLAGELDAQGDVYILRRHPGICFELEDVDDWDEMSVPIEHISVYPPDRQPR